MILSLWFTAFIDSAEQGQFHSNKLIDLSKGISHTIIWPVATAMTFFKFVKIVFLINITVSDIALEFNFLQ